MTQHSFINRNRLTLSPTRTYPMISTRISALLASAALLAGLAGCSSGMTVNTIAPVTSPVSNGSSKGLSGLLQGGRSPISGATISVYAVGTAGYGSASALLGGGTTTSSPSGQFTTVPFTCPTATSLIYILSVGGDAGSGAANGNAYLLVALGNCQAVLAAAAAQGSNYHINIDEITTATAAYALAPFITATQSMGAAAVNIGAPASNLAGIANAFAEVSNVVSTAYGAPYAATPAGNGTVPYKLINTVADMLVACVNTSNPSAGASSPGCSSIFADSTPVAGTAPTDTFQAAVDIARYPAHNVSNLINDAGSQDPFQPTVATANDLTMSIAYTGGGLSTPDSIAIDANGNAWVASAANAITELGAGTGSFITGATTSYVDAPNGIAIDTTGSIWLSNCGGQCSGSAGPSTVTVFTPAGNTSRSSNFSSGLSGAYGIALDGANQAWVPNSLGTSVARFNSSGLQSGTTGYTATFQSNAVGVAIDGLGDAWTVSPSSNALTEFNPAGNPTANGYQGTLLAYPFAVAIDASERPWVVNQTGNSLSIFTSGGLPVGSPLTGGGLSTPNALAFDGSSTAWVTNANGSVSAFTASGAVTPSTGYTPGSAFANSIAVDGAGSLWLTSCGSYCTGSGSDPGSVYQVIGVATPVVTPIALAVQNNTLASAP